MRWKLDLLLWPRDQETEFPVEACWVSLTQESQTEQIHPQTFHETFFWLHWHDLHVHQWSGRPGFNPRLSHTKDEKNGTSYRLA